MVGWPVGLAPSLLATAFALLALLLALASLPSRLGGLLLGHLTLTVLVGLRAVARLFLTSGLLPLLLLAPKFATLGLTLFLVLVNALMDISHVAVHIALETPEQSVLPPDHTNQDTLDLDATRWFSDGRTFSWGLKRDNRLLPEVLPNCLRLRVVLKNLALVL